VGHIGTIGIEVVRLDGRKGALAADGAIAAMLSGVFGVWEIYACDLGQQRVRPIKPRQA
jgi:hypothetical protein